MTDPAGLSIDFTKVERWIDQRIRRGGDAAAEHVVRRAKARAPVRKIFKGTTYRGEGISRAPRIRQVGVAGERVRGHANSAQPLLRVRKGGRTFVLAGDLRRTTLNMDATAIAKARSQGKQVVAGKLKPLSAATDDVTVIEMRGGKVRRLSGEDVRAMNQDSPLVSGGSRVTSRGRYEIRSGRANIRGTDGQVRVGGRLRDSIHVEGPVEEDGVMTWYVVADAKDPETGRYYGWDQEFGTRRHAPHPFLRPALQESRQAFVQHVRRALSEGARGR